MLTFQCLDAAVPLLYHFLGIPVKKISSDAPGEAGGFLGRVFCSNALLFQKNWGSADYFFMVWDPDRFP